MQSASYRRLHFLRRYATATSKATVMILQAKREDLDMVKKENHKEETEYLLIAAQNNAIRSTGFTVFLHSSCLNFLEVPRFCILAYW